jgi:hypothetical protein
MRGRLADMIDAEPEQASVRGGNLSRIRIERDLTRR